MPAPWTSKGSKAPPLVAADQFLILDSTAILPVDQNKRVTLTTVQANLVTSVNANDNNITALNSISINDSANNNTFTISSSVDLAANRTINLPLLTANDTFVFENFIQSLTNKTFTGTTNQFENTALRIEDTTGTPFIYTIKGSSLDANHTVTLPDLTADDTFALLGINQTFTGNNTFRGDVSIISDSLADIVLTTFNNNNGAFFDGRRANGTEASPLPVNNNQSLTSLGGFGYDGTSFELGGFIEFEALGTWSNSSHPTEYAVWTTATSSTTNVRQFTIIDDGTASFEDNSITNIASILLNDSDDSHAYTILGGALAGDFNVTIPAITASDTFALLGVTQTFTGDNIFKGAVDIIEEGTEAIITLTAFTPGGGGGFFNGHRARGTEATPLAVIDGNALTALSGFGFDGTSFELGAFAEIISRGTWTNTSHPAEFDIFTVDVGSTSFVKQFLIDTDGTASFQDNSIINIASILLNDADDSHAYTILGGALAGDFNVTIPAITASDTFALLGVTQTFTGAKTFGAAGDVSKLLIAGTTSGTIILDAVAEAGSNTLSLPATTDTIATISGTLTTPTIGTSLTMSDGANIVVGTTTGTQIGTGATQRLGFFGTTAIVQPAHIPDPAGGATIDAEARTAINSILAQLASLGLQASS